jgi:uncharacterized protein
MMYIDPHIHMSSRTTDDYQKMRDSGIVAVIEPAFWLGQPRTNIGSFQDYFSSLVGWERFRAAQFGIRHYCTIGLNSKEANNEPLAEQVMELLPLYACKEGVVAIGEIGYDDMTPQEDKYFRLQLELAKELDMLVMIHTPHRNKKAGTSHSMDVCIEHGLDPSKVIVDHNNEETVQEVLDRGFWAAFTIYPNTKMGNARMVEVVRQYGCNRIIVDSSADWGAIHSQFLRLLNSCKKGEFQKRIYELSVMKMHLRLTAKAVKCTSQTGSTHRPSISDSSLVVTRCFGDKNPSLSLRLVNMH